MLLCGAGLFAFVMIFASFNLQGVPSCNSKVFYVAGNKARDEVTMKNRKTPCLKIVCGAVTMKAKTTCIHLQPAPI